MMIEDLGLGIPEDSHAAYRLGITRANLDARIAAFAAIRRAASEARVYDRYSKDLASREIHDTARMYESWAGVIRQAIRTAIGSRKV